MLNHKSCYDYVEDIELKTVGGERFKTMNGIYTFLKKETVFCVSLVLAATSMFFVPPDQNYWTYIDFKTLAILFCLMCVMAGLQKAGVFEWGAGKLLSHVRGGRSLILMLVLLCFFSGMFITNDVALITFVPFTFIVLDMLGNGQKDRLILPVVVMQTIAANLGSMLTPIGNPQNLFLFGKAKISVLEFIMLMLPYTVLSLGLLTVWSLIQGRGCPKALEAGEASVQESLPHGKKVFYQIAAYLVLFLLCLLAVGRVLPWQTAFFAVIIIVFITDKKIFIKVDYSLLLTFVFFFVFVGNVGRIPVFRDFLQNMIADREIYTAIIASQIISNVPAALLLSGFTENYAGLIVGTNLGGLGTLIASMASLISYKYVAKEMSGSKSRYIVLFTIGNIIFLAALVLLNVLLVWH